MADLSPLGLSPFRKSTPDVPPNRLVVMQHPLRRVLAYTRRSIDDVVNCPIAKNEVAGYFKLQKWVARGIEVRELERQWNPVG